MNHCFPLYKCYHRAKYIMHYSIYQNISTVTILSILLEYIFAFHLNGKTNHKLRFSSPAGGFQQYISLRSFYQIANHTQIYGLIQSKNRG
jgi:hypothetical protein